MSPAVSADSASQPVLDRSVSTSPIPEPRSTGVGDGHSRADDEIDRPLTRAAARLRAQAISPIDWLEGFGHVDVQRRHH